MTNYQKYQLQWMVDNDYSLDDLMTLMENYRMDNDANWMTINSIFYHLTEEKGFDGKFWVDKETFKRSNMKFTDTKIKPKNIESKYYCYDLEFWATLPLVPAVKNKENLETFLINIAENKILNMRNKRFNTMRVCKVDFNFNRKIHFEAKIHGYYRLVFRINKRDDFMKIFNRAILGFEDDYDHKDGIGLYNFKVDTDRLITAKDFYGFEKDVVEIDKETAGKIIECEKEVK